ncbi:MAG: HlyD family efflux transporter periplasmic adaptor subunit [Myxococcales bacterium]|nr:HlyD family efflux transporter periplasmic adaptor subunit [Myxococcales bacterium]
MSDATARAWAQTVVLVVAIAGCSSERNTPSGYQGIIEHDDRHLGFRVGGQLREIRFDRGDLIEEGALIAVLDDTAELPILLAREADLARARAKAALVYAGPRVEEVRSTMAELDGARAVLRESRANLDRNRNLPEQAATARSRISELEAAYAQSKAQVRMLQERLKQLREGARPEELAASDAEVTAAEAAVDAEKERLALYALHASERVTVLDVPVRIGEVVAAGATVVTVADTKHPYVDVFVPQQKLSGLAVGLPARIHVDTEGESFDGEIEHIAPTTEFTPRFLFSPTERSNLVVRVRVRINDPEERLHAGVPAFATFESKGE